MKTQELFYRVLAIVILSAALLPGLALAGVLAKGPPAPVEPVLAPHHSPNRQHPLP
jgi:hypothetical protein